jgi:hypothetical protein
MTEFKEVYDAYTFWIFSEIIPFQTSLDLSIDPGLMSHLITHTCSEWTFASTRIFTELKYNEYILLLINDWR